MYKEVNRYLEEILQEMGVSMSMIFDRKGDILWHTGRLIHGNNIHQGDGFCKTYVMQALVASKQVYAGDVFLSMNGNQKSKSSISLYIKSLVIQQIHQNYYIYIDSLSSDCFNNRESAAIKVIGNWIVKDYMLSIIENSRDCTTFSEDTMDDDGKVKELAIKYATEDDTIMITGETGVGKSHLAQLIHDHSCRKGKFVVADATTINEQLFDSVLFGHKKGSFTGAVSNKKGLVDEAAGGTLFIDEVWEVPLSFQSKLLRFVETKKYRVLGESSEKTADVRLIVASNKDLLKASKNKEFRQDLYFRLNVLVINIPPLRKRNKAIRKLVMKYKELLRGKQIGEGFWEAFETYTWPGNVRELLSTLKRTAILVDGEAITGRDIMAQLGQKQFQNHNRDVHVNEDNLQDIRDKIYNGMSFWEAVKKPFIERELKRSEVKRFIASELVRAEGVYKNLMDILNLAPQDYHRFMRFLHEHRLK